MWEITNIGKRMIYNSWQISSKNVALQNKVKLNLK